jgi:cytochrome c6
VPLALTGYELGLLVVALVFIAFALIVALVIPRSRPDFPAKRLGVFIGVCVALFAAQLTAVLVLAEVGEADEPVAHEETGEPPPAEPPPAEPPPAPTETTETETTGETGTETETETTEGQGDPVAGKEIFLANCGSCHTLADAGTTGEIGPNLDDASPSHDKAVERVTNGQGVMPSFADTLSEQQIQDVAAYVSSVVG